MRCEQGMGFCNYILTNEDGLEMDKFISIEIKLQRRALLVARDSWGM